MYETNYLNVLRDIYEWSIVSPDSIDDTKYTLSKKLSEVWSARHNPLILFIAC